MTQTSKLERLRRSRRAILGPGLPGVRVTAGLLTLWAALAVTLGAPVPALATSPPAGTAGAGAVPAVPAGSTMSPGAAAGETEGGESEGGETEGTEKEAGTAFVRQAELDGLEVQLEVQPLLSQRAAGELTEGDPVAVRFTITDSATGTPMPGLYPAGWMDRVPAGADDGEDACKDKVASFLGGSLLAVPEVDLNVYHVLALNADSTISVVDPLFGFGGSKLLAMVFLPSPGEDWALTADRRRLYVSLPDSGSVAAIDTGLWKIDKLITTGGRPGRVALQPDGRYLWVADDGLAQLGDGGVVVIDTEEDEIARVIPTGAGPHEIVFDRDGHRAFIGNAGAGSLTAVSIDMLAPLAVVEVGGRPVSLDYSEAAAAVYVSDQQGGVVTAIDAESLEVVARMQAEPGLGQLRLAPGDRIGFVVNPQADRLHVFDVAANRIVQTGEVEEGPDQLAFSDEIAYVRHAGSETVLMVPLMEAGVDGPLPIIDFPGGQQPFGRVSRPSPAAGIVQAPGAAAVLVANPADQMIYYYKEGMAAPMGSFKNYSREPRAVMVVDRSLRERTPGRYETAVQLRRPGRYDLAFFLDSPRAVHCFSFEVAANSRLEAKRQAARATHLEFLDLPSEATVGEPLTVRVRLSDRASGEAIAGVEDLMVLSFLVPGTWQERSWAEHLGDGVYRIELTPPREGIYRLQGESRSRGVYLNRSPSVSLWAKHAPDRAAGAPVSDDRSDNQGR